MPVLSVQRNAAFPVIKQVPTTTLPSPDTPAAAQRFGFASALSCTGPVPALQRKTADLASCASPSPTTTVPSADTARALLKVPFAMKPRPVNPSSALQRNACALPEADLLMPTTTAPSAETAVA